MGNKQSDNLFNNQQPRNIFSLYGPKTTSSQTPSTSMQSSKSDSSTCQLDNQKKLLRLSRAHRTVIQILEQKLNKRLDGFKVHNTPTSLMPAFKFITKYLDAKTTAEINASLFDQEFIKYEIKKAMYFGDNVLDVDLQENQDSKYGDRISDIYGKEQQLGMQVVQIKQTHKRPKGDSLKTKENYELDNNENVGRPTAMFGNNIRNSELLEEKEIDLPQLGKKDTFGELGGIQITNQQSFEDPEFAAVPCRQTAYFGEIERQSKLKGYYKQLAQNQFNKDDYYQNVDILQNEEVKEEEEDDDESGDENSQVHNRNNFYQEQNKKYLQINQIDQSNQDDNYSEEDSEEPALITIDLSAIKKQKQQEQQIHPIVVNLSKDTSKQTSSSKSPKSQSQIKQVWKPTSPNLVSTTEKSPTRTINHKQSNSATKSPIRIDSDKKERKKSASFLIINKSDKTRDKNKSHDFTKNLNDIDSQIDKLTNDIEVLDLIKKDISKVQNKIIKDMSPSYRQQNEKK